MYRDSRCHSKSVALARLAEADRDCVQTRELVGRYGRRGQADAFIWSGRAKARYARIACSSGLTPKIVIIRFML